jgi:hypothetical protein
MAFQVASDAMQILDGVISPRANRSSATRMAGVEPGPLGKTIQKITYATIPQPINPAMSHSTRTNVGSTPKYAAIPPATPPIFLSVSGASELCRGHACPPKIVR